MLGVSGASLSNLNWLAALSGLNSFGLSGASVPDISPLAGLTNLSYLYITENPLTNCSVLAHLPRLEALYLDADSITDLSFAADLRQLKILSLWRNRIADLTPLTALTNLIHLEAGLNLVTNISSLDGLTNLQSVQLSRNLLDLTAGSKAMGVIQTLQRNGASVDYQPQLQPPEVLVRPQSLLPSGQRSWLTFEVVDGAYTEVQPPTMSARSLTPELIPEETFATTDINSVFYFWDLGLTPTTNKSGAATLLIAATNYAGLWTNVAVHIQVVPLTPFNGQSLDSAELAWSSGGDPAWFSQNAISHDGQGAAQSGADNSFLQTSVTGPGTLSFWFKLESDYYYANRQLSAISRDSNLHLYEHLHRSSEQWQQQVISLPAGEWVVKWSPSWDNWSFGGSNTLWLDQISFTPGSPACWLESVPYELPNGDREVHFHGALGQTYEVQVSADLHNWSPLTQITCENLDTSFRDWNLGGSARFYRTRTLP